MALPNIMRRLFRNDGYGPLLKPEIIPFTSDLASRAADVAASTEWLKDLVDAELYVDASAAAGGDGYSAATAFQTISEAVALAAKKNYTVINISGGTYGINAAEHIRIEHSNIKFVLLGNVAVNGSLDITRNASVEIVSSTGNSYKLTISRTGSQSPITRAVFIDTCSQCICRVNLDVSCDSGQYDHIILVQSCSSLGLYADVTVTSGSGVTTDVDAISIFYTSNLWTTGNITLVNNSRMLRGIHAYKSSSITLNGDGSTIKIRCANNIYSLCSSEACSNVELYNIFVDDAKAGTGFESRQDSNMRLYNLQGVIYCRDGYGFTAQHSSCLFMDGNNTAFTINVQDGYTLGHHIAADHTGCIYIVHSGTLVVAKNATYAVVSCYGNSYVIVTSNVNFYAYNMSNTKRVDIRQGGQVYGGGRALSQMPGNSNGTVDSTTFACFK